jgi:hypothetical protein
MEKAWLPAKEAGCGGQSSDTFPKTLVPCGEQAWSARVPLLQTVAGLHVLPSQSASEVQGNPSFDPPRQIRSQIGCVGRWSRQSARLTIGWAVCAAGVDVRPALFANDA